MCTVPQIDSNGISLNYTDSGGDGRPVVLIHGWPLSGASWSSRCRRCRGRPPRDHLRPSRLRRLATSRRTATTTTRSPRTWPAFSTASTCATSRSSASRWAAARSPATSAATARTGSTGGVRRRCPAVPAEDRRQPRGRPRRGDARAWSRALSEDRDGFLDGFTTNFFSAGGELKVTEEQRQECARRCADAGARRGARSAASAPSAAPTSATTSTKITVPTLVIHGDSDAIVPFEVSGKRTAEAVDGQHARRRRGCPARLQRQPRGRVQPRPARVPALTARVVLG